VIVELRLVQDCASPSVLVDGVDAMGAGIGPAACRLDLPTVDNLRDALRGAADPALPAPAGPDLPAVDCCATPGKAIRADRPDRAIRLSPDLRHVHQTILRHFAATGTAPRLDDIAVPLPRLASTRARRCAGSPPTTWSPSTIPTP
jgi:hypothetical protein